tara:strand:+ start:187 stop:441 length:255 start_codon:yes stop_codon:yes gene_type:complete
MKLIVPASILLISLAACTAPDGEPLITKPGCGLIGCGGAGSYSEYREAIGANSSETVSYNRIGNSIYGSDGTICNKVYDTVYCN